MTNPTAPLDVTDPSSFTEDQISEQIKAGRALLEDIRAAAKDLAQTEFRVEPGHYGFAMTQNVNGVNSGFILSGIERPDDNPFVINAGGSTFWFKLSGLPAPNVTRAVHFTNCANISLKGAVLDGYTSNNIEGTLVSIDRDNNRIEVKLYPKSITNDSMIGNLSGTETRIVTQKADGEAMPALYNINNSWGVEYLYINKTEKSGEGTYWFTFRSSLLLNTIYTDAWQDTYGAAGVLETGDRICLLYGTIMSVALDNCKQITIEDLDCYLGKGSFWENGGYGNHQWLNCYFGPRPGTTQILGGEGNMSQGLRHGSTFDNLHIGMTSDDAINIHGFWSKVKTVNGSVMSLDYAPVGIEAGDPVEFYDASGNLSATGTVAKTPAPAYNYNGFLTSTVELEAAPPANAASLTVRWPNSECAGWVIKNSTFESIYQRILIQCGPGTFENNRIYNMGSNLALDSNTADYEGGFLRDVVIRNNVFLNSAIHPGASLIRLWFNTDWSGQQASSGIRIEDNVFAGAGAGVLNAVNTKNLTLSGNVIINPLWYTKSAAPSLAYLDTCFFVNVSSGVTVKDNYLFERAVHTAGNRFINEDDSPVVSGNKAYADAQNSMEDEVRRLYSEGTASAADIVAAIKSKAAAFK